MTYSLDFRQKVVQVRAREGLTVAQTAARFDISMATVQRWVTKLEPQRRRIKPATKIDPIALARDVRGHPGSYIYARFVYVRRGLGSVNQALPVRWSGWE